MKNSSRTNRSEHNVLTLGGAGFLGSHVIAELLGKCDIAVLEKTGCNLSRISKYLDQVHLYYIDNLDYRNFFDENSFDFIINCSVLYGVKESYSELIENNVTVPLKIIESCSNRTKAFINTDTFFNKPENSNYSYLNNYIKTKRLLEESLQKLDTDVKIINLKLEHLYGPGDSKDKFIPSMVSRLSAGEKEIALTAGEQVRDFIYVKDVARAYCNLMENIDKLPAGFTGVSAGTGKETSIRDIVSLMKDIIQSSSELVFGALPYRENEIMHSVGNPAFLKNLGWTPEYDLEKGLKEIIQSPGLPG